MALGGWKTERLQVSTYAEDGTLGVRASGAMLLRSLVALDVALVVVALGLLLQRRRDLRRLRAFVQALDPLPRDPREAVLCLAKRCYLLPLLSNDPTFCLPLFGPLGATPSAVIRLGGCCSGHARLFILALAELEIRAYQITLYHRDGNAQHCLVEACLDGGRLIVDPTYGIYYATANGDPIALRDLQAGSLPVFVPLISDRACGYPANSYYDFDFRASRTANWTKTVVRRIAYSALHRLTNGAVDRLEVPAVLEWPQRLLIAVGAACAAAVNAAALVFAF